VSLRVYGPENAITVFQSFVRSTSEYGKCSAYLIPYIFCGGIRPFCTHPIGKLHNNPPIFPSFTRRIYGFSVSKAYNYFRSIGIRKSKRTLWNYPKYFRETFFVLLVEEFSFNIGRESSTR